jgi:hypothetical protein
MYLVWLSFYSVAIGDPHKEVEESQNCVQLFQAEKQHGSWKMEKRVQNIIHLNIAS